MFDYFFLSNCNNYIVLLGWVWLELVFWKLDRIRRWSVYKGKESIDKNFNFLELLKYWYFKIKW